MKIIAAIDKNRALGRKGELLYHLPGDLKNFKAETIGKTIVMGRVTVEGLPGGGPLPGRTTLMLTRKAPMPEIPEDAIICGGAQIYEMFIDMCDELILTEIDTETEDADAFFPEFKDKFQIYQEGQLIQENGISYKINRYRRKENLPHCTQ